MQLSDGERQQEETAGIALSAVAQMSFLLGQTFLPLIAMLPLWWMRRRPGLPPLACCHLGQTLRASIMVMVLQFITAGIFVATGGVDSLYAWVAVEFYFLLITPFAVFGMIGLGKALAGKKFIFPVIGVPCED